jgi:hypothetical protein
VEFLKIRALDFLFVVADSAPEAASQLFYKQGIGLFR